MKHVGDFGAFAFGLALSLTLFALFALLAWKYWHGQWLRSIAGNNFVTDEEYSSPEQRTLGKRVSVAMVICCAMIATIPVLGLGSYLDNEAIYLVGGALCGVFVAALIAYLAWMFVKMGRERRVIENKLVAENALKAEDVKLNRKATAVLLVILAIFLLISLVVPLLAKQ